MRVFILASALFFTHFASAQIPGLASFYTSTIVDARNKIVQQGHVSSGDTSECSDKFLRASADGKIEILVAFGYMDVYGGDTPGESDFYGNGNTLDIDARKGMESALLSKCSKRGINACGFSRSGDSLVKTIRDRFTGKRVSVRVQLIAPSISSSDSKNRVSNKQMARSEAVRSKFLSGLMTKDVVLYLGHARSGGGPDFFPPVLTKDGHVNYAHYRSEKEGLRSMLGALKQGGGRPSVIGLLSCASSKLFAGNVRKYAPSSVLVTANSLFGYNSIVPSGYSIIEATVSQTCGGSFAAVSRSGYDGSRVLDFSY